MMTLRTPATGSRSAPHATRPQRRTARTADRPTRASGDDARRSRRPDLERQSISFTVGLYLFICVALLLTHVTAGGAS